MKTLYLLRHAHTYPTAPPLMGDHERFLTPQGVSEATALGTFMQTQGYYPDFVLSSSSVRTIQTARHVFGVLFSEVGTKISSHFDRVLYQASAARLIQEIRKVDNDVGHLLVVAHNPGIAELADMLGHHGSYVPGTLTVFKVGCKTWGDFAPRLANIENVFVPQVEAA